MAEPSITYDFHLAGNDRALCQDYCTRNNISWNALCTLSWVVLNCVFEGEPGIPTGVMQSNETVSAVDFAILNIDLDFDGEGLLSKLSEQISQHNHTVNVRADSASEVLQIIAAEKHDYGDRMLVMLGSPKDDLSAENLQHLSANLSLPSWTLAVVTVGLDGNVLIQIRTRPGLAGTQPSAESLARCFAKIMLSIVWSGPGERLRNLHAVDEKIRTEIFELNTRQIQAVDGCVHELIDAYAASNPNKPALVHPDPDKNLSYARMSSLTTALASVFRSRGISKGDAVPSLFEKGPHTVLATLATLKAGAAYVGLNSESPISIMKHAIKTVGAKVMLTSRIHEKTATLLDVAVIIVDDNLISELESWKVSESYKVCPTRPTDLAMFALTSGSTGKPKAAAIEHRSLVSWGSAVRRKGWFYEGMRALQFSAPNFDGYPKETLIVLLTGGTICMPTEEGRLNDVAGMIRSLRVDWFGATPSLLRTFGPSDVPNLSTLGVWGEAVTQDVVDRWDKVGTMINSYGPAECTISSSINIYGKGGPGANNIGEPLECAAYWVVSPWNHHRLVPVGAVGELMIQGVGVSRGYVNDPAKTKAAFVTSPEWAPQNMEWNRFYRTGDLVRQLVDGSFEYIGRMDKQVKLNGQRLELGEVEMAVKGALNNRYVVAVELVKPNIKGNGDDLAPLSRFLTAFISTKFAHTTAAAEDLIDAAQLSSINFEDTHHTLQQHLRPFAIPRLFVPLHVLPLTATGKLDRKMLQSVGRDFNEQAIERFAGARKDRGEAVETPTEFAMRRLFARALNVNPDILTKGSDFFLLGGDSVRAIELVRHARSVGINLTVPMILLTPLLSDLASMAKPSQVQSMHLASSYSPFEAITILSDRQHLIVHATQLISSKQSSDIEDIYPATDYQSSCVAWTTLQQRGAINWLVYDIQPPQTNSSVSRMCSQLVARHSLLRSGYISHGRRLYQVIFKTFQAPMQTIDCADEYELDTIKAREIAKDASRVVDIQQPQIAFTLLTTEHGVERLLIRICHAQYDGQSIVILKQTISDMLNHQYSPEPGTTFGQYLHQARSHEYDAGILYWQTVLEGAEMTCLTNISSNQAPVWLDKSDRAIVRSTPTADFSPPPGVFVNAATLIQAAWALALAEASGRLDVVFGATTWGRGAPFKGAITVFGSLLSHVPVRVRIVPGQTHEDLLHSVHRQRAESMQYESIGANTIVEKSTFWPRWTRFSSLVVFQGLDIASEDCQLTENKSTTAESHNKVMVRYVEEVVAPSDRTDLLLHVDPRPDNTTRTTLRFSSNRFTEATVSKIADSFLTYVATLAKHASTAISGTSFMNPMTAPVTTNRRLHDCLTETSHGDAQSYQRSRQLHQYDLAHLDHCLATVAVATTWSEVLQLTSEQLSETRSRDVSCMAIWGNLICCASLATRYRQLGYVVHTETIMRAQSMLDQEALLCSRPVADEVDCDDVRQAKGLSRGCSDSMFKMAKS